jgi:hypothetical protein
LNDHSVDVSDEYTLASDNTTNEEKIEETYAFVKKNISLQFFANSYLYSLY